MKKLLSILLALIMVVSLVPFAAAETVADDPVNPDAVRTTPKSEVPARDPDEIVTVIVKLKENPVAARVDDIKSPIAEDVAKILRNKQTTVLDKIRSLLPAGAEMKVKYTYTLLFNGFALELPYCMIERILKLDDVLKCYEAPVYEAPKVFDAEDTRLSTSVGYINADDAWNAGYTGQGTTIAVIDTGIAVTHKAFSTAPSNQKMSTSTITTVLNNNNLHAEQQYSGLTASNLYYSGKIPFRFDYAGSDLDVGHSDAGSDHGSHVAGIAAGYYSGSNYTGVAKDAQLVVMKVFGSSGGAGWDVIMAALEDCAYLEVDAVNLSLGAGCGYTSDGEDTDAIMTLLTNQGCNVACAAGNDGSSNGTQYYGSSYKTRSLAMNPDNGIIGSPATYTESLAVACSARGSSSMIYFSSHGTTADLKIKPEVSAPGESIYSATPGSSSSPNTTSYGTKSGTSMSCPHVAGSMALLTNYVKATWPELTGKAKVDMVNRLLMCTANPVSNTSPRTQGAGIIDLQKAITTKAYITVDGCVRPKLEIGDDPNKTGEFTLNFNIVNFGSTSLSFTINPTVLVEGTVSVTVNSQSTYGMSGSSTKINSSCTIGGDTSVTVPANSTKPVTVTIKLGSSIMSDIDSKFPNGTYIDGYVVCDGTVDLVVPFLGFYGNWNQASVFDRNTYIDAIKGVNNFNIHLSSYQTQIGATSSGSTYYLFGVNPYMTTSDWLADRCTLSPNGDNYYDKIDRVIYDLIRNSGEGGIKIYNEDDPSIVYYEQDRSYNPKAWNYPNGNSSSAFYHSSDNFEFSGWDPSGLAEGTHIVFNLYHYLDNPGFTPEQNECAEIKLPMTIDTTAPVVTYWNVSGGTLNARIYDEHYAAWIGIYSNAACTNKITEQYICETERGAYTDIEVNVGSYSTVYVKLGDYGHNTSDVITLTGTGGSLESVDLEGVSIAPETVEMIPAQTARLTLTREPAEAINFDVVWSSSDESVATVIGTKSGATVTSVAKGTAVITATATDNGTGEVFTATAAVRVKDGYTIDHYVPVNEVVTGEDYLIGFKNGDNVYLLMNYNPNPLGSNNYYYSSSSIYYSYGVQAVTDGDGNVTGVNNSTYSGATLDHVKWIFSESSGYYLIQSGYQSGYYLRVYSSTNYADMYAASGTSYATSWLWDSANSRLSYYRSASSSQYATYAATLGSYQHFFSAPTSATANSTIQLYRHVVDTVIIDDTTYTVTFKDWDGTVLKTEEVAEGDSATPPEDPSRSGYIFTGWDTDYTNVQSDLIVTAVYHKKGDYNRNGETSATDALLLLRATMEEIDFTEEDILICDMNNDGQLTATDALLILRLAME